MNTATQLNLARKWRSQQFDQIIGQDLAVRMLKNSLYLEHFFPVYLFSVPQTMHVRKLKQNTKTDCSYSK